jgi:hypothetical protein
MFSLAFNRFTASASAVVSPVILYATVLLNAFAPHTADCGMGDTSTSCDQSMPKESNNERVKIIRLKIIIFKSNEILDGNFIQFNNQTQISAKIVEYLAPIIINIFNISPQIYYIISQYPTQIFKYYTINSSKK